LRIIIINMILKTFLKKNGIELTPKQQSHLGLNVSRCFRSKYPTISIQKVSICSKGIKMDVYDYPRDFFETDYFNRVLTRFMNRIDKKESQISNQ